MSASAPQLSMTGFPPLPTRQPLVPASGWPGSGMDKGVLCGLTVAGGAAGCWLRIADETEPFVVPPQAQYFFLGAGCVPGRADDGCAHRRLPARQLPSRSFPLRFNAAPAPPLLPGHCQALAGLERGCCVPCSRRLGPRERSYVLSFHEQGRQAFWSEVPWDQGISFSWGLKEMSQIQGQI